MQYGPIMNDGVTARQDASITVCPDATIGYRIIFCVSWACENRIQQDFDPIVYARIRGELYNNR